MADEATPVAATLGGELARALAAKDLACGWTRVLCSGERPIA